MFQRELRQPKFLFRLLPLRDIARQGEGVFLPIEFHVVRSNFGGKYVPLFSFVLGLKGY